MVSSPWSDKTCINIRGYRLQEKHLKSLSQNQRALARYVVQMADAPKNIVYIINNLSVGIKFIFKVL